MTAAHALGGAVDRVLVHVHLQLALAAQFAFAHADHVVYCTEFLQVELYDLRMKEGNISFNNALKTFCLWLCDVRHMVKEGRK